MSNIKCVPTKMSTLLGNPEAKRQFESLLKMHWEEVDPRSVETSLSVCFDKYVELDKLGLHFMVVAYEGGNLLGYSSVVISPCMHTGEPTAVTDAIFIKSSCRHRGIGKELIGVTQEVAKSKGVKHFMITFKNNFKHDHIVEGLGLSPHETVYVKYIGD